MEEMKQAMRLLLDKKAAAVNLLQPSRRDVAILLPFSDTTLTPIIVGGDADAVLAGALRQVNAAGRWRNRPLSCPGSGA